MYHLVLDRRDVPAGQRRCPILTELFPTIDAVNNFSNAYAVPNASETKDCYCNSVLYSLIQACTVCQGYSYWKYVAPNDHPLASLSLSLNAIFPD